MDFNYTPEQDMLRESVARYLADHYDFRARQAMVRSASGWHPEIWRGLAEEIGVLGASFPEAHGGLGGGPVESMIVMEEIGRSLAIEPYLETVVVGGGLLQAWNAPRAGEWLQAIASGQARFALAQLEPGHRYDPAAVETRAEQRDGGWHVTGVKDSVRAAPFATHLLVTARTAGSVRDRAGVSVFLVARDAPGVTLREYPTVDGSRTADVRFDAAAGELLGEAGRGLDLLDPALDAGVAGLCAEAVGVMRRLVADTVDYTRQRRQFDAPIASNQVLQHRMVDMYIALEQSVSMACLATLRLSGTPTERVHAVSAAKVFIGKAARAVGQAAIQLHGGMGMTDETAVSHYFRRATMLESQLGSVDYHAARIEQLEVAA